MVINIRTAGDGNDWEIIQRQLDAKAAILAYRGDVRRDYPALPEPGDQTTPIVITGQAGSMPCPFCSTTLSWWICDQNGHVHASCRTPRCVAFLE